jgi:hypothetical protein
MALIKPEQLQSGSYSITGSFSGSFYGDGSNLNNLPVPSIDTGSLVTTSSFNSFTSSYYADSGSFSTRVTNLENFSSSLDATFATEAELNAATSSLSASISYLSSSFETFSGSYNTGSFTGSFVGDGAGLYNLPTQSIDTSSLATTGSNTFYGLQTISASSVDPSALDIHVKDDGLWAFRIYNDAYSSSSIGLASWIDNTGISFLGTETDKPLYVYNNANYYSPTLLISSSGVTIDNTLTVNDGITGSLYGTASWAENSTSASYALTASYLDNYIPPFPYTGSAEITGSLSVTGSTSLFNSGSTILSVNGAQGEIFNITDDTSGDLLIVQSGSTDLFVVSASGDTTISGSLTINGPQGEIFSITDDLTGDLFTIQSSSVDLFVVSASGDTTISGSLIVTNGITSSLYGTSSWAENSLTASYIENAQTASYVLQAVSASYALTASYVNTLNQDVLITGSLTVFQGATIYGSSSFTYLTASQLAVSASFISVNVFEPVQRFGGLIVYDSGSSLSTASIAWDSLHNHWVYQNASGSTSTGGMFLSGPRNTGSLGNELTLTQWFIPRSDGTDHLDDSQIYSSGSIHIVTGSLTVTAGITGSLFGTASWAENAITASYVKTAQTASYVLNAQTASYVQTAQTASYVLNAVSSSFASTSSYSNLTINSTPIAGGTSGNVLFQNAGLLLSSTNLVFNTTLGFLSVGQLTSPGARLDIRAQGSGSSNLVFRIRNHANTNDILSLYGNSTLFYTGSSIITGSLTVTGSLTNQPITLTATSGTASMNCTQGNFFNLTLSSSSTIHLSSSNIQPGQTINLRITQPATSGSLTYGSQFKFAGGIPYSASATGSVVDIVSFISFDSTTLYGSAIKNLS